MIRPYGDCSCLMYQRDLICCLYLPSSQNVLFSLCWRVSVSIHWVSFATSPHRATTHKSELSAGKEENRPFFKHVCWQAHGMRLFHCNRIPSRVYFSTVRKLCWKTREVDCRNVGGHRTPGWHNAAEIVQPMLLQEQRSSSAQCFLLSSYFSSPRPLTGSSVNFSTPSVIFPSIWPRKIIVTSCWGTTLNIWGITRQR